MNDLFLKIYDKSVKVNYHTNVLGLIRSILAFSTLTLLVANPSSIIFHSGLGISQVPYCTDSFLSSINLFCVFSNNLVIALIVAIAILVFVISGYFPKITGLLHWWVAFSVNAGLLVVDGGCQVAAILTFLLIPLTLTENRSNHWQAPVAKVNEYNAIASYFCVCVLRFQVAFIYLDASISKLAAPAWSQGTALYYFINDPIIGADGIRLQLFNFLFDSPVVLVLLTYLIILLEFFLALSLFIKSEKLKKILFNCGIIFHLLIFLTFGIFTFVVAMFSALIILFVPLHKEISVNFYKKFIYAKS